MPKNKIKLDTPPHTPKQTKNKSKKKGKKRCKVSMETVMRADKVRSAQKQGLQPDTERKGNLAVESIYLYVPIINTEAPIPSTYLLNLCTFGHHIFNDCSDLSF